MNMDKENFEEEEQKWHSYLLQPVAWQLHVILILHTCRISRVIALHSPDLRFHVFTAVSFSNDFIFRIITPRNALYLFRLFGKKTNCLHLQGASTVAGRCCNVMQASVRDAG